MSIYTYTVSVTSPHSIHNLEINKNKYSLIFACKSFLSRLNYGEMVVFKRKLEWRRFIGVIMWMFMLFIIFWLAKRSKPERVRFEDRSTSTNISIASELARIPDRLCFLWISTRDNILRKSNYPCKHQYGLELQVKHKNLHLLLCILLAGDVATNPGPTSDSQSTDGFKILYLNARSLKAFVHPPGNTPLKVCKISLFQDLVYSGNYDVVCVCEDVVKQLSFKQRNYTKLWNCLPA